MLDGIDTDIDSRIAEEPLAFTFSGGHGGGGHGGGHHGGGGRGRGGVVYGGGWGYGYPYAYDVVEEEVAVDPVTLQPVVTGLVHRPWGMRL